MKKNHLNWSIYLNNNILTSTIIYILWKFPHDLRRKLFSTFFHKKYWNLMGARQGLSPPSDYGFCDKYKCIFVHVPKAAGTSIYKQVLKGNPGHRTITEYQLMYGKEIFNHYYKFSITRNPWDRLVSAFCYLKYSGSEEDKNWAKIALAPYDDFDSFVRDLPNNKYYLTWVHFIPQYKFLMDPSGKIPLDYIGKMENLDSEISLICKNLGIDNITLKKDNPSPNRKHYSTYYTEETKKIVSDIYQKDIKLFGYTF